MEQLVEVHGKKLTTSSLVIAEQFGKRHDNILRKIDECFECQIYEILEFTRLNFKASTYIGKDGAETKFYLMSEEGFTEIAMSLTGEKAKLVRIRFLNEFKRIHRLLHDPKQKVVVQTKRDANKLMNDALVEQRKQQDKATEAKHFITESKLCNWAITGKFEKVNETLLTVDDLSLLAKIRRFNESLIMAGLDYKERKPRVADYAERQRSQLLSLEN
jgi:Rha family phage regulatory protein